MMMPWLQIISVSFKLGRHFTQTERGNWYIAFATGHAQQSIYQTVLCTRTLLLGVLVVCTWTGW